MRKEQLLDHLAVEVLRVSPNSALDAYRIAEAMLSRRQEIIDSWHLPEVVVEGDIEKLELTVRSEHCLKAEGIYTITQLLKYSDIGLLRLPNLGRKSLKEIIEQLDARGLKLRGQ
jgi:DNA-directed RNA polymerase alpha subunit